MNPLTELICNSDQHFSDYGRLEFLRNYDKILELEIQASEKTLRTTQQTETQLEEELRQQQELVGKLRDMERGLNDRKPDESIPEIDPTKGTIHETDALAWARCEINVPDMSNYNEFIRQLENDHVLERLENNRRHALDQLKKLLRTLEEVSAQARDVDLSMQQLNQNKDRASIKGSRISDHH